MPRSGAEARARLVIAAIELYAERGYDHTTTAEIATRAGVTERTFFRHFADKREVFFGSEATFLEWLSGALAAIPFDVPPFETVLRAFRSRVPTFEANRAVYETRRRVFATTPALAERDRTKEGAIIDVIAEAFRQRGLSDWRAMLLAKLAMAAQSHALQTWSSDPATDIDATIVASFAELVERDGPPSVPE